MALPLTVSGWKTTLEAAKKHTIAQGELICAASLLHDGFFKVFLTALALERPDEFAAKIRFYNHALALWHITQSDAVQREMALQAITTVPTQLKIGKAIKALKWSKKIADTLSSYRNILAHTPVTFRFRAPERKFVPSFGGHSTKVVHSRRLELIDGLRFWQALRDDLLKLSAYVDHAVQQIEKMDAARRGADLVGSPEAWSGRPRLRSLRRLREIESQLSQAMQEPARRSRRQRGKPRAGSVGKR
jgi:hypothetical protein